jgi:hypothetical protein
MRFFVKKLNRILKFYRHIDLELLINSRPGLFFTRRLLPLLFLIPLAQIPGYRSIGQLG